MLLKDFYDQVRDNCLMNLNNYKIQKDSSTGERYINTPIPTMRGIIEMIEAELNDPWEEIEDFDEVEDSNLTDIITDDILKEYDRIIIKRKEFMESLHPGEEYKEIFEEE